MSKLSSNTANLRELLEAVNALPEPVALPELTNPGTASELLKGKELIDGEGNVVVGSVLNAEEVLY